ncbi:MAG TPA: MraY family glycosyltransferase [Blastocatellia bacterium]|nr:MraY family glycosyltransferase [Blastocatellia bacterium]
MTEQEYLACLSVGVIALMVSLVLVPLAKAVAEKLGVLDYPGERKIHRTPKPLLGGCAVYASLLVVVGGSLYFLPEVRENPVMVNFFGPVLAKFETVSMVYPVLLAVFAGSMVIVVVGILDDVLGDRFPIWAKLAGQALAALIVVLSGVEISLFGFSLAVAPVITFVWIVGITNSFNLLDNMDGLTTGVAIVCALLLLLIAGSLQEVYISLLLAAFIGALAGFLIYNFPPSQIFLGDAGSLLIGYFMGVVTVLASYVAPEGAIPNNLFSPFMPVIVLGLPLYDTASVILIRLREGRPIFRGDKSHLSHRLVELGMTERQAVLAIYLLTFCLGASAIFLRQATVGATVMALVQSIGIVVLTTILMIVPRRTYYVQIRAFAEDSVGARSSAEAVPSRPKVESDAQEAPHFPSNAPGTP